MKEIEKLIMCLAFHWVVDIVSKYIKWKKKKKTKCAFRKLMKWGGSDKFAKNKQVYNVYLMWKLKKVRAENKKLVA